MLQQPLPGRTVLHATRCWGQSDLRARLGGPVHQNVLRVLAGLRVVVASYGSMLLWMFAVCLVSPCLELTTQRIQRLLVDG